MGWDLPQPHTLGFQVAAEHIDGLRHTNNAVYVVWCEQVAWDHSITLGLDLAAYQRLDRAMAITRSEFDYLKPSYEGDELVAATWIVEWDQKLTMRRHFQVMRPADGSTLLRAAMQFACVELSSGRPRRLPQEFIDGYGPAIVPDPSNVTSRS